MTKLEELQEKVKGIKKELELIKQNYREKPHLLEDMLTQLIGDIEAMSTNFDKVMRTGDIRKNENQEIDPNKQG